MFRRGLAASGATGAHPRGLTVHFAESRAPVSAVPSRVAQLAALAERHRGVEGLVTSDPALAESFATSTGLKAWTLTSPKDGGWCAGLPGLLAPRK